MRLSVPRLRTGGCQDVLRGFLWIMIVGALAWPPISRGIRDAQALYGTHPQLQSRHHR